MFKKTTVNCLMLVLGFLSLSFSAQAATLEDAKVAVANDEGKLVHPKLYRPLTDEEKEMRQDWPDQITQTNREMTKVEAEEYFSYIDSYQAEHQTTTVPAEAYDYVQYIAEKLEVSPNTAITDDLRSEAKAYAQKLKQKSVNQQAKAETKAKTSQKKQNKKPSFWAKLLSFNWF